MLQLRPNCECCNTDLAGDANDAYICSFECTFCADCVDGVLGNVCPNCGGGFSPRPVRPMHNLIGGNFLQRFPAGTTRRHRPVDVQAHAAFTAGMRAMPPEER